MKPETPSSAAAGLSATAGQATRFFAVGLLATGVHMAVAMAVVHFLAGTILAANIAGYCLAFLVSYLGHTTYSFRTGFSRASFVRFLVLNTLLFLLSSLVSWWLDRIALNRYLGVVLIVGILPPTSFLVHKFLTFRQ